MTIKAGLWIDHRKAVIVFLDGREQRLQTVESDVERHPRPAGGRQCVRAHGLPGVVAEDRLERRYEQQVRRYEDAVAAALAGAEEVLIFGPAEAKQELAARLNSGRRGPRVVGVEAADKMSENQIAAKVRQHYREARAA